MVLCVVSVSVSVSVVVFYLSCLFFLFVGSFVCFYCWGWSGEDSFFLGGGAVYACVICVVCGQRLDGYHDVLCLLLLLLLLLFSLLPISLSSFLTFSLHP